MVVTTINTNISVIAYLLESSRKVLTTRIPIFSAQITEIDDLIGAQRVRAWRKEDRDPG